MSLELVLVKEVLKKKNDYTKLIVYTSNILISQIIDNCVFHLHYTTILGHRS